jgi:hypothetical protein
VKREEAILTRKTNVQLLGHRNAISHQREHLFPASKNNTRLTQELSTSNRRNKSNFDELRHTKTFSTCFFLDMEVPAAIYVVNLVDFAQIDPKYPYLIPF